MSSSRFLSLSFFFVGGIFAVFFLVHYLVAGKFSPHIWAGFLSGFLVTIGFALGIVALIADMLGRMRMNQEEILYRLKKNDHQDS